MILKVKIKLSHTLQNEDDKYYFFYVLIDLGIDMHVLNGFLYFTPHGI